MNGAAKTCNMWRSYLDCDSSERQQRVQHAIKTIACCGAASAVRGDRHAAKGCAGAGETDRRRPAAFTGDRKRARWNFNDRIRADSSGRLAHFALLAGAQL